MPVSVGDSSCGAARTPEGNAYVVFAGGFYDSEVHVYHVSSGIWLPGPLLPFATADAAVVQTENSFLLVGG